MHNAYREFDVMDGKTVLSSGEIRYTFTVTKPRAAVTWANASGGFSPAEDATVDITEVAIRMHQEHPWKALAGAAFDAFSSDVPNEWFLAQLEAAE